MKSQVTIMLLLLPLSICYAQPPVANTELTFYITDENLVTDHRDVMEISTDGLVDFTINGTPISGPSSMVETGMDTGVFQLQLTLPDSVGGRPLHNGDVVLMTYHQRADYSGNPQTITQSVVLNNIPASPIESSSGNVRIGQYFTLTLNAPNFNLDSQVPDDIPLTLIEVHMGGHSTTLADPAFSVNTGTLRETSPNTGVFQATFKIPKQIGGIPVEIGSILEFRFTDNSQQSPSSSSVFVQVGTYQGITAPSPVIHIPHNITMQATNSSGSVVNFLNSTVLQGLVDPVCFPPSDSLFPMGTTTVTCAAKDQAGNSVLKSFAVTITKQNNSIPHWITKLTSLWCNGNISDDDFKTSLKFLISNKLIIVSESQNVILDKSYACLWAGGKISDDQVANLFYQITR
jgi:hypothetical protein